MPTPPPPPQSRALVPWKYQNPFANTRHSTEVTLLLHGQSLQVGQDQEAQVTLHQNTGQRLWDGVSTGGKALPPPSPPDTDWSNLP
ncbi:hypothetical protein BJ684DRAFT_21765 [Piptocephalis cylindrospora]|uniref:Uncharacterized protein n=1 Tax=Piptocephalis cylindrospora TaxID=1907219 RepID=A0A4P9XYY3_9FUNG|nr:hypothetical protein BJ684DRAFT_21765 [Piptocephalis cylindrospora]|eukprot:RKP11655.1 hypothetical protein BJ684DRAFT_21765 [Piptocephalis cylindrospora]